MEESLLKIGGNNKSFTYICRMDEILEERRNLLMGGELTPSEQERLEELNMKMIEIPITETWEYLKSMEIISRSKNEINGKDN